MFLSEGFKTVNPKLNGKSLSLEWESTIYHTPQDDMKQKLNFEAGAKFARVDLAIGVRAGARNRSGRIGTPAISS